MAKNSRGSVRRRSRRFVSGASSSGYLIQPDGSRVFVNDLRVRSTPAGQAAAARRYGRLVAVVAERQEHFEAGKRIDDELRRAVNGARKSGATWGLIAGYLGLSPEQVRRLYKTDKARRYVRKLDPPTSTGDAV